MAVGKVSTFKLQLRSWSCQRKATQELFKHRVFYPQSIPLHLSDVLIITQTNGPLQGRAKIALEQTLSGKFPLSVGPKNVRLDLEGHRAKETLVNFPIDKQMLQAEIMGLYKEGQLYEGKILYNGLLVIGEFTPDLIRVEQNPNFSALPQTMTLSTAQNIQKGIRTLTTGIPDEAVKDLIDGDFETVLKIMGRDFPGAVKAEIAEGKFEQIIGRQERNSLLKILTVMASGISKLEQVFQSQKIKDLFPFLPFEMGEKILSYLGSAPQIKMLSLPCLHIESWLAEIRKPEKERIEKTISEERDRIQRILRTARNDIQQALGMSLEDVCSSKKVAIASSELKEILGREYRNGLLGVLLPTHIESISRIVSENQRSKIVQQIRKSNLIKNVKIPLLHILAEKELVYVSMFSFTSPLFAAALIASMLRGAEVKVLLDRREAAQSISQYENLTNFAQRLSARYPGLPAFEVRTFSGATQHQKNILTGSGIMIIGSQNLSERGFTSNLEDLHITNQDFEIKRKEFEELFSISGSFVPFSEEILSQHWIRRAGLNGIRFRDKVPSPSEVSKILGLFSHWRTNDFRKVQHILDIAQGKKFDLVVDLAQTFQPFTAEINNPVVTHFLTRFLEDYVPLRFCFEPASGSGKNHPGTTIELSGLIEHTYITAEIAIKLCQMLGREDLIDPAVVAVVGHDSFKRAFETPEGDLAWGRYNPAHGHLAAQKFEEAYQALPFQDKRVISPLLPDILHSVGEHMSIFNKPEPTPLISQDPTLKFIMVFADMLASRKYFYVKHRNHQPLEMDEVLHLLLNTSFSIEGEALERISKDQALFRFIQESSRILRYQIKTYADLPRRTKKMLRVAESLCDMFPESREVALGKRKEVTEEEKARTRTRNEILTAALLYGTMRYKYGITEPNSKKLFEQTLEKLRQKYGDSDSRQARILELIAEADKRLVSPYRADLSPQDAPALWILAIANCMMTAEDVKIVTIDEVDHYLSKAKEPKTIWVRKKFDPAVQAELLSGINGLATSVYADEMLSLVEAGLRFKFNRYNPKTLLPEIPKDVIMALINKYKCLSPSFIYDHFYTPLSQYQRSKLRQKLYNASRSAEERRELIQEITNLPDPETISPTLLAQTALVNNVDSIEHLKDKIIDPARDMAGISEYGYFRQIGRAVDHILNRIGTEDKILIYGDYDVDGQTGTAILTKTLRWIRAKELSKRMDSKEAQRIAEETISFYIPDRLNEGYGLNADALEIIHRRGAKLVITTDCGIKDRELIKQGRQMGIEFIVTDHHEPEKKDLPEDAVAILNPKLDLSPDHPAYDLPGAAMPYKLAKALTEKVGIDLRDSFLDSVALAAVADIVPLKGENRAFVRAGLKRLNSNKKNRGLSAIIKAYNIELVTEESLAYFLAPMLNGAGRFGAAGEAMDLLMSRNEKEARTRISKMFTYLEARRDIEQSIFEDAEKQLEFDPEKDAGIAVFGEWHKGIIGIVASKLVSKYGVPSVTIGTATPSPFAGIEPAYGSMRSIKGVSAIKILRRCAKEYKSRTGEDLFISFGGHAGAAGFKIDKEKIADLQRIYAEVTQKVVKSRRERMLVAGTLREGEIGLEEIKVLRQLLAPFGNGFEEPLFYVPATIKKWWVFGKTQQHIRGVLEMGTRFVIFNGNQPWIKRVLMKKRVRLVGKLSINVYKGREEVNLIVEDVKSFKKRPKRS